MADHKDPHSPDPGEGDGPKNPFEELFARLGLGGAAGPGGQPDLNEVMQNFQSLLSQFGLGGFAAPGMGGGARTDQIRDMARRIVAGLGADPTPSATDLSTLRDAVRLADTWIDQATDFPATGGPVAVWSRAEWVEKTMPTWQRLIEPVATSLSEAMADTLTAESEADAEAEGMNPMAGLEGMLRPWFKTSGSMIFGMQAGQAIGTLAASVLSATETTLPLVGSEPAQGSTGTDASTLALVPTNVAAFADGLDQSANDVHLYLTLREVARQRLFHAAPWLGSQIMTLVEAYAKGITIDLSSVEEAMGGFDPTQGLTPESLQGISEKLQGSLFAPKQTAEQREVLEQLETKLALVEGWVDEIVAQATKPWMPNAGALAETLRRRRATGGAAEATFKALVGLELRPRRVRDAANLWAALRDARGASGRDAVWSHPDLAPSAGDLDDPLGFVTGDRSLDAGGPADAGPAPVDDLDAELRRLLSRGEDERQAEKDDEDPENP